MNVRRYDDGRALNIAVEIGGDEHHITAAHATALRDALTRELGAPQVLTLGEMVAWAVGFSCERVAGSGEVACAAEAAATVRAIREARAIVSAGASTMLDPTARAMLAAVTGGGK